MTATCQVRSSKGRKLSDPPVIQPEGFLATMPSFNDPERAVETASSQHEDDDEMIESLLQQAEANLSSKIALEDTQPTPRLAYLLYKT
jgi:hypothetical protein